MLSIFTFSRLTWPFIFILQDAKVDSASGDENFEALSKYGTDLTAAAARLDPVIGRDEEVSMGRYVPSENRGYGSLCSVRKERGILMSEEEEVLGKQLHCLSECV